MKKYNVILSAFFLLIFSWSIDSAAQETAYVSDHLRTFKDGKTLFNIGTYAAAQDQLSTFLQETENFSTPKYERLHMEAEFLIAQSALRLEQSNAERLLLTFIRDYKPDPYAHKAVIEIASYYYNDKKYEKAVKYFKELDLYVLSQEKRTEVRFKIGYCEFVQKNFELARSQFQLIKDIEGIYYYPANYYLAMTHYFTEDYDRALRGFRTVDESRKYRDVTPYYISQIYFLQDRFNELIPYAEEVLQDNDIRYRSDIEYLLGQAHFKQGNYQKALPLIEERAKQSDRDKDLYQLAFCYYKNQQYQAAAKYFKRISDAEGKMGQNTNFYLGDTYVKLGNKADARVAFANASRKNYNEEITEEAQFNYGKISAELQYDREAVNALQDIQPSSHYYVESQKILSDVFYDTRDYAHSIEIMESMQNLSPDLKKAYQRIALYYGIQKFNDENMSEAIEYLNKSLEYPLNLKEKAQAHYWKAYILNSEYNYDESINQLNSYFTLIRSNTIDLPLQSSEIMARYLQGYNYFKKENYEMASGQFGRTVSLIRTSDINSSEYVEENIQSDALLREGDCLFKANSYNDAISRYNQALEIGSASTGYALYQKAIILGLQQQTAKKILNLNRIADDYPNSPYADDALLELGRTYQALQKFDQAIPPLQKLVHNYEGKSNLINEALLSLGLIAYNQGDVRVALNNYKKIFKNNPDKQTADEALSSIEEIYIQDLGRPDEYVTFMEEVRGTEMKSTSRDSLTFRSANLAFESGNYDKAIANFTNYIQEFPKGIYKIRAHYYRAESYAVQQQYKEALRDYEFVVAKGPGNFYTKALEKAAKIAYNSTEEFAKATRYYGMLETNALTEEQRFEAQIGGMEAAYRAGNNSEVTDKARKVSSNPIATEKNIATAQYYIGMTAMKKSNYDQALNAFNQVTQYSNDEKAAEARYNIANIYYMRQEYDLAQSLCEKAYQASSAHPYWVAKSLLLLSDILIKQDDLFNARAAVEAIIENYKDNAELLQKAKVKLDEIKSMQNKDQKQQPDSLLQMEEN